MSVTLYTSNIIISEEPWVQCFTFDVTEKKQLYHFTQLLPKTATVRQKKEIVLECMLSDTRPHVKWLKNGQPIDVSIRVSNVTAYKAGP